MRMRKKEASVGEHAWAAFEAEALPHADQLFRVAMWFELNVGLTEIRRS
jgi:hypothetical protein